MEYLIFVFIPFILLEMLYGAIFLLYGIYLCIKIKVARLQDPNDFIGDFLVSAGTGGTMGYFVISAIMKKLGEDASNISMIGAASSLAIMMAVFYAIDGPNARAQIKPKDPPAGKIEEEPVDKK